MTRRGWIVVGVIVGVLVVGALVVAALVQRSLDDKYFPEAARTVPPTERAHVGREGPDAVVEERDAAAPVARGGDWRSPHPEDADLARRLADERTSAEALAEWEALSEARRLDVLRQGLRMEDSVAFEAAMRMEWWKADGWESRRIVDLLMPHVLHESEFVDFDEFRSVLGSDEIDELLARMRTAPEVASVANMLQQVHRQLRADHLPALVEIALSNQGVLSDEAFEEIANLVQYTDRHRTHVARLFHGMAEAPGGDSAIPAELVVALRAMADGQGPGGTKRGALLHWALRWLADERPQAEEAELLFDLAQALGRSDHLEWPNGADARDRIALLLVRAGAGKRVAALGPARSSGPPTVLQAIEAAAALVLGDPDVIDPLERKAAGAFTSGEPGDHAALALLLEVAPQKAQTLINVQFRRDPAGAIDALQDADTLRWQLGLDWDPAALATVAQTTSFGRLHGESLLELAARFPEWRSGRTAASVVRWLAEPGRLTTLARESDVWESRHLPFLELGAGDALRGLLRDSLERSRDARSDDATAAATALALLRDEQSGEAIVAALEAGEIRDDCVPYLADWVDPSFHPRIAALLGGEDRDTDFEYATRAAMGGIPRPVALEFGQMLVERQSDDSPPGEEIVTLLRAGDGVGAVLRLLDEYPGVELEGLGRCDDPRVAQFLAAERERRVDGRAHWAIGEAILAGDEGARTEMRDVVTSGRYRWVDNASADALTLGGDPETLEFWLREAESNCCRAVPVKRVFEDFAQLPVDELLRFQSGHGTTLAEWLRYWVDRCGGLAWSEARDGYVLGVR